MTSTTYRSAVPGLDDAAVARLADELQDRLASLLDLQLTLKHVHWNVAGPTFIAVHEMLDPQVIAVRSMTDAIAERIATIGGEPRGTTADIARAVDHEYGLGQAMANEHLAALASVLARVVGEHRASLGPVEEIDPVSADLLIGQIRELELFSWFVRSHLEHPRTHFGRADDPPTDDEAARAEQLSVPDGVSEAYQHMAELGANVRGEGAVD